MKLIRSHIYFLILLLFVVSCEEEFIVENEFKKAYVLNCIIDATSDYHIATVSRTYEHRDDYPLQNYGDRFIEGASISITKGSETFTLEDSVTTIKNSQGNPVDVKFYYTYKLKSALSRSLSLVAVLPDGDTLKADTQVPSRIMIERENTAELIPPNDYSDDFRVTWKENDNMQLYYDPRLKIIYSTLIDGDYIRDTADVPIRYNNINGARTPLYISPSFDASISYSMDIFDKTMTEISAGDEDKGKYYIEYAEVTIYTYDEYLTSYYIGTHLLEPYSVRLDEVNFSNIEGGYGIFGSFDKITQTIAIDPRYIKSFGYEPLFKD